MSVSKYLEKTCDWTLEKLYVCLWKISRENLNLQKHCPRFVNVENFLNLSQDSQLAQALFQGKSDREDFRVLGSHLLHSSEHLLFKRHGPGMSQRTTFSTRRPIPSHQLQEGGSKPRYCLQLNQWELIKSLRSLVAQGVRGCKSMEIRWMTPSKPMRTHQNIWKYLTRVRCILQLSTRNVRDARFSVLPVQYSTVRCSGGPSVACEGSGVARTCVAFVSCVGVHTHVGELKRIRMRDCACAARGIASKMSHFWMLMM